jgi:hypothetical protein
LHVSGGLLQVEQTGAGYGSIEVGGPSGALMDFKTPFSDDYDFRIQVDTSYSLIGTGAVPLTFWTNTTERLRIDSSGNVGIGTSSPLAATNYKFVTVQGGSSGGGYAIYNSSGVETGRFQADTAQVALFNWTASLPTIFYTNATERARIDSSGNVGIGTASPDALLTVNTVASFGAGTVGAPSIAAKGDLNTGIYFSAADTLDFSTAGTQRGQFDSSGNFKFNSGYGSVATAYGCRAWVNFDGTGTPSIRASGNVTSITDGGTGLYTVNFTNAMPDSNFAGVLTTNNNLNDGSKADAIVLPSSASSVSINLQRKINDSASSGQQYDADFISVVIFR